MDETEEKESSGGMNFDALIDNYLMPCLMVCILLSPFVFMGVIKHKENEKFEQEFAQFGCLRINREYQECGPVEGKPGFTKCTTKTEKVCPETK